VIYMDVLVALNWFLDYLLLCGTARLMHIPCRRGRRVWASLVGALLAAVLVLPPIPSWAAGILRLTAALPVIWLAFGKCRVTQFLSRSAVFFLLSTALAGVVLMIYTFAAPQGLRVINGVIYYDVSPWFLALLTAVSYGGLCLWERVNRHRHIGQVFVLHLTADGGTGTLRALYDSGNRLTEQFSGAPVIVAAKKAVWPLLSTDQKQWVTAFDNHATPPHTGGRWRLVPYRSVGGTGMLPAFCPTRVWVTSGRCKQEITGVYIAICDDLNRGEYTALIGTAVACLVTEKGRQNDDKVV